MRKMCLAPQAFQSDVLHVLVFFFFFNKELVKFYKQLSFFLIWNIFFFVFSILKYWYKVLDDTVKI